MTLDFFFFYYLFRLALIVAVVTEAPAARSAKAGKHSQLRAAPQRPAAPEWQLSPN